MPAFTVSKFYVGSKLWIAFIVSQLENFNSYGFLRFMSGLLWKCKWLLLSQSRECTLLWRGTDLLSLHHPGSAGKWRTVSGSVIKLHLNTLTCLLYCLNNPTPIAASCPIKGKVTLTLSDGRVTRRLHKGWSLEERPLYYTFTRGLYTVISVPSSGITLIWDKYTWVTIELHQRWRVSEEHFLTTIK